MRLFLAFLVVCGVLAVALRRRGPATSIWVVVALALAVSAGYYFLNQL